MDEVRSVAFNDTGNLLAALPTGLNLKIWELPSERLVLDTVAPHKSYLRRRTILPQWRYFFLLLLARKV